ncbi:MAG TPA: HlyD family efflux transporter periplasmic adaptor subunit [Planctomycetes bacterium]|nr:HlyD family efflux transporter periplasmic adaptor subunit [Planctomycetota bacterium]
MSTEQRSVDPNLIEETKQQIRSFVNEIAQLARADIEPEQFYGEFLQRVIAALAAVGGAVWTVEEPGRLTLGYQINLHRTNLREDQDAQIRHGLLLQKVLTSGEPVLVPPHSGQEGDQQASNPTDFLLIVGLVKTDRDVFGLVEVFQRPDTLPATQQGYLRFVVQMCEYAADYFKSRQLRHLGDRQVLWTRLEEFTRTVHSSLDPRQTAYTIANEGRRLIECDRVTVAIRRGRRCRVEAVSGQDLFDKRSNTVHLLGKLATAVVASGEDIWYTGETTDMAPQVEDAFQEYVDESHSKMVAVLPLHPPQPALEEEEDPNKREPPPPVGALIVEQIEDNRVPDQMRHRVDVVRQHSSAALANAMEYDSLFLMPLWRKLGKSRVLVKARNLPKTVSITAALLLLIILACVVPADFELEGRGELQPVVRRDVFAEVEGTVVKVHVEHGDRVEQGQVLVELDNPTLKRNMEQVRGNLLAVEDQIATLRRRLYDRTTPQDERGKISGDLVELEKQEQNLENQLALYKEEAKKLIITSPIKGQVITWDVRRVLMDRPVQRGQKLMRIADPDQEWHLEINMPEHRTGYISRAAREIKPDLDVEYILKSQPGTKRKGNVKEIGHAARVVGDEGNMVPIKVAIDYEQLSRELPELRPGTQVSARVHCGRRPVGFVWLHDAIAFVQSKILFRLF